jgi:hypothetical protein
VCPVDLALAAATKLCNEDEGSEPISSDEDLTPNDEKSAKSAKEALGLAADRIADCSVATFEASTSRTKAKKMRNGKPKKKKTRKWKRKNEKRNYGRGTKETVAIDAKSHEGEAASKRQRRERDSSVGTFSSSFVHGKSTSMIRVPCRQPATVRRDRAGYVDLKLAIYFQARLPHLPTTIASGGA